MHTFTKFRNHIWNDIKRMIEVSRDNNISCFFSTEDLNNDIKRGKMFFNKEYAERFINNLERDYKKYWEMFKELKNKDFSKLSNRELFGWYERIMDMWSYILGYFRVTQAEGTHYLVEEIKKSVSPGEASLLMLPADIDDMNLELLGWQKIIKKRFSKKVILEHCSKHPWLAIDHFTYKDVIETLKQRYDYDKNHLVDRDIRKEKEELKKKQENIFKKYPKIKSLAKLAQRLAISRVEIKSCWAGTDFYLIPLHEEVAKRGREEIDDLCKYYFIGEIKLLLEKNRKLTNEAKKNRAECFVGLLKNGKVNYYFGKKAEKIAQKELGDLYRVKTSKKLKGVSANPGKVIGTIRILLCNNIENTRFVRRNFKRGEVLVTQMTQPNIMDIASKAAAIITDEGGMLSHAAIISRELKIPCIVGTHIATQVLKDGDLVEVDANHSIVKIIKKK